MIRCDVQSEAFRREFGSILQRTQKPRTILQAACRAGRTVLQRHFRQRDRVPNRLGGRRTHFWGDVLKSTQLGAVTDKAGVILIGDSRFAQKVYGGTIVAKNVRNLSIPVNPEAHGLRPRQFEAEHGVKLFFIKSHSQALLAHRVGEGYLADLQVDYVLKPRVYQQADPDALPGQMAFEGAIVIAAQEQLDRELAQAAKTSA